MVIGKISKGSDKFMDEKDGWKSYLELRFIELMAS